MKKNRLSYKPTVSGFPGTPEHEAMMQRVADRAGMTVKQIRNLSMVQKDEVIFNNRDSKE